jgi:hypothetical protein
MLYEVKKSQGYAERYTNQPYSPGSWNSSRSAKGFAEFLSDSFACDGYLGDGSVVAMFGKTFFGSAEFSRGL